MTMPFRKSCMAPVRRRCLPLLLAALGCFVGCGEPHEMETALVRGTVTLDEQPLTQGIVVFTPERGRVARGNIARDGSFTLGTYAPSDGAVVGEHSVIVVSTDRTELPEVLDQTYEEYAPRWLIPRRYGSPTTSGLSYRVQAGENNVELKLFSDEAQRK